MGRQFIGNQISDLKLDQLSWIPVKRLGAESLSNGLGNFEQAGKPRIATLQFVSFRKDHRNGFSLTRQRED